VSLFLQCEMDKTCNICCNAIRIRYVSEEFNNYMQQDAHEFLNFLINRINEIILRKYPAIYLRQTLFFYVCVCVCVCVCVLYSSSCYWFLVERNFNKNKDAVNDDKVQEEPTWVHEIFQGILTSETRCLNCETVSARI
jgi:uncharacterized UBP type Zn finger protein